jgi:hypothetical protein
MLAWRNLRNIGFVTQSQYQQEMEIKRPASDVYQLESENSSSEEEEKERAPRSKARPPKSKKRVIEKASKRRQ